MTHTGRVAIVTGAGSGIGEAIAHELASQGAAVMIADIAEDRAVAVADRITGQGGKARAARVDVTSPGDFQKVFDMAEDIYAPVDVLVNNAGTGQNGGIRRIDEHTWERTVGINLNSVFYGCQLATSVMVPRRSGTIINISSRAWLGWYGQFAYAATKGAVVSATRSLAIELARHGITVNCIAPGLIDTPLMQSLDAGVKANLMAAQPTGTLGRPQDVAWATRFLTSPAARSITGQVLYVCGGKSIYAQPANQERTR